MTDEPPESRRPLASRDAAPIRRLTGLLLRTRVTPDQISAAGLAAGVLAGVALLVGPSIAGFLAAAVLVQLRLLANLLDGLVAVEGRRAGPLGALWNEVPDRVADPVILAGFGWAAGAPVLGLVAAVLAVFTAYLRLLGASLGRGHDYAGPMAKQQRMAAVTAGCVLGAAELALGRAPVLPLAALWLVVLGTGLTAARRIVRLARGLA
jgi:phosphatidylglycerophosphate synthase